MAKIGVEKMAKMWLQEWGKNIFLVIWTKQIMLEDDPTEQEFHFLQCQR